MFYKMLKLINLFYTNQRQTQRSSHSRSSRQSNRSNRTRQSRTPRRTPRSSRSRSPRKSNRSSRSRRSRTSRHTSRHTSRQTPRQTPRQTLRRTPRLSGKNTEPSPVLIRPADNTGLVRQTQSMFKTPELLYSNEYMSTSDNVNDLPIADSISQANQQLQLWMAQYLQKCENLDKFAYNVFPLPDNPCVWSFKTLYVANYLSILDWGGKNYWKTFETCKKMVTEGLPGYESFNTMLLINKLRPCFKTDDFVSPMINVFIRVRDMPRQSPLKQLKFVKYGYKDYDNRGTDKDFYEIPFNQPKSGLETSKKEFTGLINILGMLWIHLVYSHMSFLANGKLIPIFINVSFPNHSTAAVLLPDKNWHKWTWIYIDTSAVTVSDSYPEYLVYFEILKHFMEKEFRKYHTFMKDNVKNIVVPLNIQLRSCQKNIQKYYGSCASSSLSIMLSIAMQLKHGDLMDNIEEWCTFFEKLADSKNRVETTINDISVFRQACWFIFRELFYVPIMSFIKSTNGDLNLGIKYLLEQKTLNTIFDMLIKIDPQTRLDQTKIDFLAKCLENMNMWNGINRHTALAKMKKYSAPVVRDTNQDGNIHFFFK